MTETLAEKLRRLARHVVAGDVVFFIGAGYSIDSEGNTATILIARLLARFEALTERLKHNSNAEVAQAAEELRTALPRTFRLKTDAAGSVFADEHLDSNLDILQQNYYLINDWMCSAFEKLLECLSKLNNTRGLAAAVGRRENQLLRRTRKVTPDIAPMEISRYVKLYWFSRQDPIHKPENAVAGKALFLDTMGFASEEVMGGNPMAPELEDALKSYGTRLRPRHAVLAWLALEGLCPVLITTNYDLLLDGAWRLAGLLPLNPPESRWPRVELGALARAQALKLPLNRRFRYFARIADARQFFSHGHAYQSALLVKIHGCVDSYRIERSTDDRAWRGVLPTMVFTFREIQNWREDSWSRDYLRTLLRTRTVVFAGYSGIDPVIHDTFRSVYEEMATYRIQQEQTEGDQSRAFPGPRSEEPAGADLSERASAFFLDLAEKREFHGLEILRAASKAAGEQNPELTRHPNLVSFYRGDKPEFPHVDEVLEWTFHLAYRELQRQALDGELQRVVYQLLRRPAPEREARAAIEHFKRLIEAEQKDAEAMEGQPPPVRRRQFRRMAGWTLCFHNSLMREFALAENLLRNPGDGFQIERISRFPWYCPASERPQWAAWAVVVEMAIRRRVATWRGAPESWTHTGHWLEAARHRPAVLFAEGASASRPYRCLSIELATTRKLSRRSGLARHLHFVSPIVWSIRSETVPWWLESDNRRPAGTPSAAELWSWAALDAPAAPNPRDIRNFLGANHGGTEEHHAA